MVKTGQAGRVAGQLAHPNIFLAIGGKFGPVLGHPRVRINEPARHAVREADPGQALCLRENKLHRVFRVGRTLVNRVFNDGAVGHAAPGICTGGRVPAPVNIDHGFAVPEHRDLPAAILVGGNGGGESVDHPREFRGVGAADGIARLRECCHGFLLECAEGTDSPSARSIYGCALASCSRIREK